MHRDITTTAPPRRSTLARLFATDAGRATEATPVGNDAPAAVADEAAAPPPSPYPLDRRRSGEDPLAALRGKTIHFDGVFVGDYSLAIVNRHLTKALVAAGIELTLHSDEEDLATDPHLAAMPEVARLMGPALPAGDTVDLHLRNTWPPRAETMRGRINAYVCFAWEESVVPRSIINHFNAHLDLLLVTATFVEQAFRRSGLRVPIAVIGNGVDHLSTSPSAESTVEASDSVRRRIIHVSSCFPRKGADVLVDTFASHFRAEDDVELLIKTFDNEHNTIDATVGAARAAHPDAAPITVMKDSLSDAALRRLIAGSAVLAAPSRGEGFGLPLAEALMLGVPVVTTGYSGQTDFCTDATAFLVDFSLVPSKAHVSVGSEAEWAEPDRASLAAALRQALSDSAEGAQRVRAGQRLLSTHFTWKRVVERLGLAVGALPARATLHAVSPPPDIDLVSTWNQTCGIATYAAHLFATDALAHRLGHVHARRITGDAATIDSRDGLPITRDWGDTGAETEALAHTLSRASNPVVWFQHHPGHFSDGDMTLLTSAIADSAHATRVITLHNVRETLERPATWLSAFDAVIVHTKEDVARLEARTDAAVTLIPHGILPVPEGPPPDPDHITVGTFGFLYPHKNVPLLVEAVARAASYAPRLRLRLLTCARNDVVSLKERARVEATIAALGIGDRVETEFGFLDEESVRARLGGCDLLCFPYGPSSESATGAARIALSVDRPLLCSASEVMRDIRPFAIGLSKLDVTSLAEALVILGASPELRAMRARARRASIAAHGYECIGGRHARLLDRLAGGYALAA